MRYNDAFTITYSFPDKLPGASPRISRVRLLLLGGGGSRRASGSSEQQQQHYGSCTACRWNLGATPLPGWLAPASCSCSQAVLVAPCSCTHSFNTHQRVVGLTITAVS